jgi:tetratricopeptide (TPR) repeat protein
MRSLLYCPGWPQHLAAGEIRANTLPLLIVGVAGAVKKKGRNPAPPIGPKFPIPMRTPFIPRTLRFATLFALASSAALCFAQAPAISDALSSAETLRASGRFPEAIAAYQQALKLNPRNEAAEIGLADAYRQVHNVEEARAALHAARRHHPKSAAVLAALGRLELEAESYDAAIAALRAAVALAPAEIDTRNLLASAYLGKGEKDAALLQLGKVLARDSENVLAYFLRAQIYADQNENEKALADAEKVFAAQPGNLRGRALLAKILVRLKRCERATNLLRPAENPPALETESLFLLGNAYECAGKVELAARTRAEFAAASQSDRQQAESEVQSKHYVEQSNELAVFAKFPEALKLLQGALQKNPRNAFAYSQQAKIYFSMHQSEQAREAITQALAIQPYQPDFLYVQGVIEESAGNLDAALAAFEQASRINPKEADAYFEMGKIWTQRNDGAKALAAYRKAAALAPDDPDYQRAVKEASAVSR